MVMAFGAAGVVLLVTLWLGWELTVVEGGGTQDFWGGLWEYGRWLVRDGEVQVL